MNRLLDFCGVLLVFIGAGSPVQAQLPDTCKLPASGFSPRASAEQFPACKGL